MKMAITGRRSPGFTCSNALLVVTLCISVYTEMASSQAVPQDRWKNICIPGDAYIERSWSNSSRDCNPCYGWCRSECGDMKSSVARQECRRSDDGIWEFCQCCCKKPPSSPPSPALPPATSTPAPFSDNGKNPSNICTSEQLYLKIKHAEGKSCGLQPLCTNKCMEEGRLNEGNQCLGWCRNGCRNNEFVWLEQCCCGKKIPSPPPPSPPPPSPSPPPPSPPPPPPSPPPPSPPPPSPSPPPPTPPRNICRAGETFVPTPIGSCDLCTRQYCVSKCSEHGGLLVRMGCAPSLLLCRCCCKSTTLQSSASF